MMPTRNFQRYKIAKPASRGDTPFRINLEQQKKRAKELLQAFHANDETAILRFQQHHPEFLDNIQTSAKLSDAQLVIAREFGLPSWAKLKAHITAMTQASDAIKTKALAPDAECKTLHIRCGTDMASTLPAGGFNGDFLEYSDPYGQGPVIQDDEFIKTRAQFLYESYRHFVDISLAGTRSDLETADNRLAQAAQQYERVVLWFEHDAYDQLILAKLLAYFAKNAVPEKLEMVSINHFPGSARFIGLGQLPPEAIRLIWRQRQPVNQKQLKLGEKVWCALGQPTPMPLYEIIKSKNIKHLPYMSGALLRHLQELPSTINGLSLTEQLTLEMLNEQSLTAGQLFGKLMQKRDPLPWLGDVMYWFILQSMKQASQAVFKIANEDLKKPWHKRLLTITGTGQKVLPGTQDWLSLNPPERWLGGIKIDASYPRWHWDNKTGKPIPG